MAPVTNAASWNQILSEVSAVGAHVSGEDVSDFCGLLMLSERSFPLSVDARMASTRWLALNLEGFALAVVVVDGAALPKSEPTDTLVVVSGPGDDRVLLDGCDATRDRISSPAEPRPNLGSTPAIGQHRAPAPIGAATTSGLVEVARAHPRRSGGQGTDARGRPLRPPLR